MNFLKNLRLKGFKRHTGALVLVSLYVVKAFGIDIPDGSEDMIVKIGIAIWGAGWADRLATGKH